jgi:hypothetical protein
VLDGHRLLLRGFVVTRKGAIVTILLVLRTLQLR